jgi:hypothetical protein
MKSPLSSVLKRLEGGILMSLFLYGGYTPVKVIGHILEVESFLRRRDMAIKFSFSFPAGKCIMPLSWLVMMIRKLGLLGSFPMALILFEMYRKCNRYFLFTVLETIL